MIVLDTNVVSELMRAEPAPRVLAWVRANSDNGLYTTAVTVAEIRYGIARLPEGRRRESLHQAANEIFSAFPRQVLPSVSAQPMPTPKSSLTGRPPAIRSMALTRRSQRSAAPRWPLLPPAT